MKNFVIKAASLALCIAMLFTLCMGVFAENIDEAWDIGENYVYYGTYLSMGSGEYTMSELYEYTLFAFMPDDTGKYIFTIDDGAIGIVSYNGMWVTIEPGDATITETSVSWECTGVGQEIWLAAKTSAAAAGITVSSAASDRVEIEKIEYVNKTTPTPFTFKGVDADLVNVNTRNSTVDTAVLGEDGYYHLNSADGYILYVDLNDSTMSLSAAASYGQVKGAVYNDNGDLVAIDDYNNAFNEYYECADPATEIYPLTEDLMIMLKEVGKNNNWYGEEGWVGGTRDDAWMFCCYYTTKVYYTVGDVNEDGQINGKDSNLLMRIVAGKTTIESGSTQALAADINSDGTINAIDTNLFKRILAGA